MAPARPFEAPKGLDSAVRQYGLAPVQATGGVATLSLPLATAGIHAPGPRYFQYWYRDVAAGGAFYDTSDALEVQFLP